MIEHNYGKLVELISNHVDEELTEYIPVLDSVFNIDKETSQEILISFLSIVLCRGKIMLRKKEVDYGAGEYQRN